MSTSSRKIYLITGVNSGLGDAFAEAALNSGHSVTGTVRRQQAKEEFERTARGALTGLCSM